MEFSQFSQLFISGSKEARTPDLSRVRRTLIPAELCFHVFPTVIIVPHLFQMSSSNEKKFSAYHVLERV